MSEQLVRSRTVFRGRVITVRVDDVTMPNGRPAEREVVTHPGAVVMLAEDGEGRILFVSQHRHAAGKTLLELPAGTLERGENPEGAAARELGEETGFEPAQVERLGGFYSAPGFSTEFLHAFLCTELRASTHKADEDEDITPVRLSLAEALDRARKGEIQDAKSLATLLLYQLRQAN